jgi:uncharacterized protein YecT (DUF1311 family)
MRYPFIFAILLFSFPAMADDAETKCDPGGSTLEMTACEFDNYKAADKKLNEVYKEVIAKAKKMDAEYPEGGIEPYDGYEDSIRKSQRAWVGYRDADCLRTTLDARGGSMRNMTYPACLAEMTNNRIKELQKEQQN